MLRRELVSASVPAVISELLLYVMCSKRDKD